jgi:hypothetical protein
MQIKLKLNINQLNEMVKAIQENRIIQHPITIEDKANHYLFESGFKKLLKKQIDKAGSTVKTKEFSVALYFYELVAIYNELQKCNIIDDYRNIVVRNQINRIHLKLQSV